MKTIYYSFFFLIFLLFPTEIVAHDIVKSLENISKTEAIFTYIKIGFEHILPLGFDHILFIISLILLSPNIKQLLVQSAAFTIGHCTTLILASYNIFSISPAIVEPLIAITIAYVAAENIFTNFKNPQQNWPKKTRLFLIFSFGLLHGLGFAGALSEIGLPENAYLLSLLMFNLGVELGQITIIFFTFLFLSQIQKRNNLTWSKLALPVSSIIICISIYWIFERIAI